MTVNQPRHNYVLRNQTPRTVVLKGEQVWLTLAPLQSRRIGEDPTKFLPKAARAAHRDQVIDWEPEPLRAKRLLWATWLAATGIASAAAGAVAYLFNRSLPVLVAALAVAVGCAVAGAYVIGQGRVSTTEDGRSQPKLLLSLSAACLASFVLAGAWAVQGGPGAGTVIVMGALVGILCAMALAYGSGHRRAPAAGVSASHPPLSPTPVRGDAWDLIRDFIIATGQGLVVVVLVAVAVAAPAIAIYYGTELSSVIIFSPWNHPRLVHGPHSQYLVVARVLQLALLILVAVIPALMYFQFDRERLSTLVDRWLHAIFRLDPSLTNLSDVDAKYGRRVEEFYGASLGLGVSPLRKRVRDRSPVIVATLLIAIGWILVLLNNQQDAGTPPAFQSLFEPARTPMTLAFLGAYFLAVQVALRGYVRGDLKPKTYNVIIVRILMAVILAWVMQALWGTSVFTLGASFLAGILPSTVLRWIKESLEQLRTTTQSVAKVRRSRKAVAAGLEPESATDDDELSEKSPLSRLDDVDIYDRTRLEEEGITSIQALARHDLVDLILSSRIPVPRLIDWVDQAILHQHVPGEVASLRQLGIRTATDFLQVCDSPKARADLTAALHRKPPIKIDLLRTVLERDEWVRYLCNWRKHDGSSAVEVIVYDATGRRRTDQKAAKHEPASQTQLNAFSRNGHHQQAGSGPLSKSVPA
jgi:hypothetical protein